MFFTIFFVAPVLAGELDGEFFLQIPCVFPSGDKGLRGGIGGFDDGSLCFAREFCGEVCREGKDDASAAATEFRDVAERVGRGCEGEQRFEQRFAVGSWDEAGFVEREGEGGELALLGDSGEGFAICSAFDEARYVARYAGREG